MKFEFWLFVFMLTSNGWVAGSAVDGFAPRQQPNWNTCIERRDFAEKNSQLPPGVKRWDWVCKKRLVLE